MKIFSALLAICAGNSPVPGEFLAQRPVTRSFDVFFDLRPNKRLSKQSWGWWSETPSSSLWRHRNEKFTIHVLYVGLSHLIFSMYLFWFYVSNIYHKQTAQFHYCHSSTGPRIINGLLFGTSGYRLIEVLISLNHYDISKSAYLSFIGKSNYQCRGTYIA